MTPKNFTGCYHDLCGSRSRVHPNPSRRTFLTVAATIGAGGLASALPFSVLAAAGPGRIDIHHHFQPDVYYEFQRSHGKGFDTNQCVLSKDLEDMDQAGTAIAFLSLTTPGFVFGEKEEVRKVSRGCNEAAAKLVADHPGRFGSFATIPLADTEGALQETA